MTGTLPVLGHYALVLFDSGSSHSFISSAFVLHARLEVEPLHHVLSVSTPSGECMLSKEKVKGCQIEITGHVIEVTLLVNKRTPMRETITRQELLAILISLFLPNIVFYGSFDQYIYINEI